MERGNGRMDDGLPSGRVAFVFSDIEGSTRLWEREPEEMLEAQARHHEIFRQHVELHKGSIFSVQGDSFAVAWSDANAALTCAVDIQVALHEEVWPTSVPIRVRMSVHVGAAVARGGEYVANRELNRAARLMSAGHGGQVLVSEALVTAADAGSESIRFEYLGEFRLRDLDRPEHVSMVNHPALPADFPPVKATPALPTPTGSFVGRSQELIRLTESLRDARLVTLAGMSGIGKTRLSLEALPLVAGDFPDGVRVCQLAGVAASAVDDAVLASLGIAASQGQESRAGLTDFLRDRRILLVLDNAEHVLGGVASMVAHLLRETTATILVTSIEATGLPGERLIVLGPLGKAAADLFRVRAQTATGHAISADLRSTVERICHLLDGHPLAIEMAAAKTRVLDLPVLESMLVDRFELLGSSDGVRPDRHQTLEAAIEWTCSQLDRSERSLLQTASVFRGTFDLEALAAVADRSPVATLTGLDALVGRSLVEPVVSPSGRRFRLLTSVQMFAEAEAARAGLFEQASRRHLDHFSKLATEVRDATGEAESSAVRALARELDNVRRAWQFAVERGEYDEAARVVGGLRIDRLPPELEREVTGWAMSVVDHWPGEPSLDWESVHTAAAMGSWIRGADSDGAALALVAMEIAESASRVPHPLTTWVWGILRFSHGDLETVRSSAAEGEHLAGDEGLDVQSFLLAAEACVFSNLMGQPALAVSTAERAHELAGRSESPTALLFSSFALAECLFNYRDDVDTRRRALELYRQAATSDALGHLTWRLQAAVHGARLAILEHGLGSKGLSDALRTLDDVLLTGDASFSPKQMASPMWHAANLLAELGLTTDALTLDAAMTRTDDPPYAVSGVHVETLQQHVAELSAEDRQEAEARGVVMSHRDAFALLREGLRAGQRPSKTAA